MSKFYVLDNNFNIIDIIDLNDDKLIENYFLNIRPNANKLQMPEDFTGKNGNNIINELINYFNGKIKTQQDLINNQQILIKSYEERIFNIEQLLIEELLYNENFGRKQEDTLNAKFSSE